MCHGPEPWNKVNTVNLHNSSVLIYCAWLWDSCALILGLFTGTNNTFSGQCINTNNTFRGQFNTCTSDTLGGQYNTSNTFGGQCTVIQVIHSIANVTFLTTDTQITDNYKHHLIHLSKIKTCLQLH